MADRNPDWLASHPEAAERLHGTAWIRASQVLGGLSIGVLLAFQIGFWPEAVSPSGPAWMTLQNLNSALAVLGMVYWFAMAIFASRVRKEVPLAPRRQATLERRQLRDFVPRWLRIATSAVVGAHLAFWVAFAALGWHWSPEFWLRFVFQFFVHGFFFLMTLIAVHRKPDSMDRILGPGYRRVTVRLGFAAQILPALGGAALLYSEYAGRVFFDLNRGMHLGLVLLMTGAFLGFARYSRAVFASRGPLAPFQTGVLR